MLPMAGSLSVTVLEVAHVSIHGDRYLDLLVQTPEQVELNQASKVRVPWHALADAQPPTPGQRVVITFLMQQVTGLHAAPFASPTSTPPAAEPPAQP